MNKQENSIEPCCASCFHRKEASEFYATCGVLASKNWQIKERVSPRLPFWISSGQRILPDMTIRTLAKEGKNCNAYSPSNA